MNIISHRGYWNGDILQNSFESLEISLEKGFGFETDVRDFLGDLVISHDVANEKCAKLENVLGLLKKYGDDYCFAINIKSDGLGQLLNGKLQFYGIKNYFTFDMSTPQMLEFSNMGINYFTRQSEYERAPLLYSEAIGVWVDAFDEESWITFDLIDTHLRNGKKVCLVSPELHKREYINFWEKLKMFNFKSDKVMLCTDYPEKARDFFSV